MGNEGLRKTCLNNNQWTVILTTSVKIYWALLSGKPWANHFTSVISFNLHNKGKLSGQAWTWQTEICSFGWNQRLLGPLSLAITRLCVALLLKDLQWIPIGYYIRYAFLSLATKTFHGMAHITVSVCHLNTNTKRIPNQKSCQVLYSANPFSTQLTLHDSTHVFPSPMLPLLQSHSISFFLPLLPSLCTPSTTCCPLS